MTSVEPGSKLSSIGCMQVLVESYVQSPEAAQSHRDGGCHRLVVCGGSAGEGYCTPAATTVIDIMKTVPTMSLHIYLGKSSGAVYNSKEHEEVLIEIDLFKNCVNKLHDIEQIQGFIFHALCEDSTIDSELCEEVVQAAHPLPVTHAKPYDFESDSIEQLVQLGFKRIFFDYPPNMMTTSIVEDFADALGNRLIAMPRLTENSLGKIKLRLHNFKPTEFSFQTELIEFNLQEALRAIKYTALSEPKTLLPTRRTHGRTHIVPEFPASSSSDATYNQDDSTRLFEDRATNNEANFMESQIKMLIAGIGLGMADAVLKSRPSHSERHSSYNPRTGAEPGDDLTNEELWKLISSSVAGPSINILRGWSPCLADIGQVLLDEFNKKPRF